MTPSSRTADAIGATGSSDHLLPYADRAQAGQILARHLEHYASQPDVLVLGLARGGLPVALEVARALGAALDVYVVRKLGVPGQSELAMGAIAAGGVRVLNQGVIDQLAIAPADLETVAQAESRELQRREQAYRGSRPFPAIRERTVIVVDDGLATGATMRAAVAALRQQQAGRIVAAAPVGDTITCHELSDIADDVVCAATPRPFRGVGRWYRDFPQVSDAEVGQLLAQAAGSATPPP